MTGPEGQRWTWWHEMLSQLIEAVSVGATADTRYKHPLELPRPRYPEPTGQATVGPEVAAFFGLMYVQSADQQEETDG